MHRKLHTDRDGSPSRVLLFLALVTVAVVATPLVFLLSETIGQPYEQIRSAFLRPRTLSLIVTTVGLVVAVIAGTLAIGIPTAFLLARTDLPGRRFWQIASVLPLAIPSYVAGFAWMSVTPLRGFWGAFLVLTVVSAPYVTLPVLAALRRADLSQEHVARTLGASPWRAFFVATFPQILPAAGAGALLVGLYTISDFGVVAIMRYPSFTWAIHTAFGGTFNRSLAIVLSLVLVVIAVALVTGERLLRRRVSMDQKVRADTDSERIRLSRRARWSSSITLTVVFAAGVGLPVTALIERSLRSVADRQVETSRLVAAAGNTVMLGLAGAVLATALALPVAILAARYRTRTVSALETATYLGHGLPGIVMGLSMVYLSLSLASGMYQTIGLLVIAYGILFVPKAAGSARAAVSQVPANLEDVSRTLGRSRLRTWLTVTGPIASPGILAGTLLVALTVMKELPATLMMRPTGMDTLATRLWQLTDIDAYGAAAPYALTLIAVASVPAFLLMQQTGRKT